MEHLNSLKDRVAIVTGAGRGIGRAIAMELGRQGAVLALADLEEAGVQQLAHELQSLGREALVIRTDVANKRQVDDLVASVAKRFDRLDIMVNNAGIGHVKLFLEIEEMEWDRVFAVNAKGVLFGIQAAARFMIERKTPGRIINIASVAGKGGRPLLAAYAASKAAVISLTQSAAGALAQHQVTVNCICPGVVTTQLGVEVLNKMQAYVKAGEVPEGVASVPPAPLGPEASPEDVARMAVYLAGQGGQYITGQAINIDGGRCMH